MNLGEHNSAYDTQCRFHFPLIAKYFELHIVFIKVQGLGLHPNCDHYT